MENYGLTKYQINRAYDKLKFNKEYMASNGVHIDNKLVPFSEFVQNSYTNADRYIAELQHRAWSVYEYAKDKSLVNIFFTLTLPSIWHPMKQKSKKNKTMIFNKKFGGRKYIKILTKQKNKYTFINAHVVQKIPFVEPRFDTSKTVEKYTPRNASKELSKMLLKLFNERSYRNIDKDDRCYFRVTEPHKDGTPHLHISLFVPADSVDSIVKSLKRLYPAPLGKIETEVNSPVSYLMKYVLKTLDDLRDDTDKITNLTLWYLYHGISRFYTSRTFVSLEVYRKLNGMYTLRELTSNYHTQDIRIYTDTTTKKIVLIENEFGTIYVPKPVNWSEKIDFENRLGEGKSLKYNQDEISGSETTIHLDSGFDPIYKDISPTPIDIKIDNENYLIYSHELKELEKYNDDCNITGEHQKSVFDIMRHSKKQPYQMNYIELFNYFENLDIDTVDDKHYLYTRNLLIEKNMIDGERLKLTTIEDTQNFFKSEVF